MAIVKNRNMVRKIGRFLYDFCPETNEVIVAYRSLMSPELCRNVVEAKLNGVLFSKSINQDVVYEGYAYPGRFFQLGEFSEFELEEVLGTHRLVKH